MVENKRGWVKTVTTESVNVPAGTMTKKSPKEIVKILLRHNRRRDAENSIIRFIQFHINRGGKNLTSEQIARYKKAQELLRKHKS